MRTIIFWRWSLVGLVFILSLVTARTGWSASYSQWNLAELQKRYSKGAASPQPWAGYWWPYSDNGIADASYDSQQVSPATKIDWALGTGGSIANWEYWTHGSPTGPLDWWGHCNGWAVAAIMEREPRSSVTRDGVKFEIRDRKALLTEYWLESGSDFIGNRVWDPNDFDSAAFWDVVPAEFHLVMTNIVGRQKRAVVIDRHTGYEVWNQPLVAYQIKPITKDDYLGPDPEYPDVYRVNVTATIWWAEDDVKPDDVTPKFAWTENEYFTSRVLRYELWVDAPLKFDGDGNLIRSGNIILTDNGAGGYWKNGSNPAMLVHSHPDFIWIPVSYAESSGYKNPYLNDSWVQDNISEGPAR